MHKILTHIVGVFSHWPRLFSTRAAVAVIFLLAILPASTVPWLASVDNALFSMSGLLANKPDQHQLVVLALPPAARHESTIKREHLARIKAAGPSVIGLISDQHLGSLGAELARQQVVVGRGINRTTGELQGGIIDFTSESAGQFTSTGINVRLLGLFYDNMPYIPFRQDAIPAFKSFPVARDRKIVDYPMYWQQDSVQTLDFVNYLYKEWDGKPFKTDLVGQLRTVGMPADRLTADISVYNYKDFISDRDYSLLRGSVVLIGPRNDPALINSAVMLRGMMSGQAVSVPTWALLSKLVLAVFLLGYLFLSYRFRTQTSLLLMAFMLTLMLTAQLGLMVTKFIWLPFGSLLVLLFTGYLFMASIRARLQEQVTDTYEHDMTLRALAQYQFEAGDAEKAFISLQQCQASDEALELMYRLGIEYERQRKYDRALQVFQHIASRRNAYQDVRSRIQTLQHVDDPTGTLSAFNGVRTLIMPSMGVEKPVLGRYEIEREIGRGAMGVVYLGKDPKIMRQVAIKTMELKQFTTHDADSIKARFFREAEAAGKLNHPNIVTIFDAGEDGDLAFIAMDYATGKPLSEWTRPDNLLPVETVYRIIAQVAQAIDYAHRQGVVHRDIKPGNIIYDPDDERVRVTDFGIARITDTSATRTGTILGSPSYMSPEQVTESKVDGRADIFSLGVTMYQLLTGALPFKGDSLASVAYQITNKKHQSMREIRPELSIKVTRVVNKALQKNAGKRYATGEEMAAAVLKL